MERKVGRTSKGQVYRDAPIKSSGRSYMTSLSSTHSGEQILIIEPGRSEKNYWTDLWRYRELFLILAWRDISVRYKQTIIGILWAIIRLTPDVNSGHQTFFMLQPALRRTAAHREPGIGALGVLAVFADCRRPRCAQ